MCSGSHNAKQARWLERMRTAPLKGGGAHRRV